ncbi:hypothetical protein [Teredinibacter sp. KSP-S5-2]|uniref:hypothetical protein n=1 Tax=Teredinibacter sp. KSP-S5-2 TaxID=3034506 RepID=UPI0029340ECB|nr:hypothetical protein [Teredinibacter sp. KSP-S5-2]WNO09958.1 hypothetical protein P5V12_02110 [Teredinibacter sp. KSP-S5-2]
MFDNLEAPDLFIVAAVEVAAVLFVICVFLVYQNRNLRELVSRLKTRMEELVSDLRHARRLVSSNKPAEQESTSPPTSGKAYLALIAEQIEQTRNYHESLNSTQDIILDLSPETPLPRRAAALRYAMLLAEKEAVSGGEDAKTNWEPIKKKYEQIFSFYEDYSTDAETPSGPSEEVDLLNQELTNAKKRINNLEKFKALYFDLEEKWQEAKDNADAHYSDLTEMVSQVENSGEFEQKLNDYHASYQTVSKLIEGGVEPTQTEVIRLDEAAAGEIRHLRAVAADQHKIIEDLQRRLQEAQSEEERTAVVTGLQQELHKQTRFIQEAETCIQLMEDELHNANREIEQLKSKANTLPQLKAELKETRDLKDEYELKMYALKTENTKLNKRLKESNNTSIDMAQLNEMKKQLADMETQYASLEEKYLDLKLQQ